MRFLSIFFLLFIFLLSSCGMQSPIQTAHYFHKTMTPPEYYSLARPASFSPTEGFSSSKGSAAEVENTTPETKSERVNVAMIGILAGAIVVGGIVTSLVLLNK